MKWSCLLCMLYAFSILSQKCFWGGAVRVQDTRYVAGDVSKLSLWTATLSQQESVEIGERGRREGGAGARGDTGRIVPLSDSPFSLISFRSSYRKPDRKKKSRSLFYFCLSPISLSRSTPFFHSPSILVFIENPFLCTLLVSCPIMKR